MSNRRTRGLALAVLALVLAGSTPAGAGSASAVAATAGPKAFAGVPPDDAARGLVYRGLAPGRRGGPCAGRFEVTGGPGACTHGPDPAPAGFDVRHRRPGPLWPAAGAASLGSGARPPFAPGPVACIGTGSDGPRVQAIYARASDVADRSVEVTPAIREWAGQVSAVVEASAAKTNGGRQVRFVTDGACQVEVQQVVLSPSGDDSFGDTAAELRTRGYTDPLRKYLVWMDANVFCGIAEAFVDDWPGPENASNRAGNGLMARIDEGCWGWNGDHSVEAHELVHTLGTVVPSAPSYSGGGHCTDEHDTMCYLDGGGRPMRYVCPRWHEALLDCGNDDYFSAAPPAGSYLATHWNSADNIFLERGPPRPTWPVIGVISPGDGSATVRWAPPRSTGGRPITGYLVTAEPGGATVGVGPTATAAVVPRLANGTSYRFTVRAYSANGGGTPARAGPVTPGQLGVAALAGRGYPSDGISDGAPATMAGLEPRGVAVDQDGRTYLSDGHRLRRIAVDGTISTVAGDGTAGLTGDGGPASAARLNDAQGLAVGAAGEVYLADAGNNRVRRVTAAGVITTVAGGGPSTADTGPATDAALPRPEGLAVDAAGNLYISSPQSGQVRVVDPAGSMSLLAAGLASPVGLAVAGPSLYVAAPGGGLIQKVDLATRQVSTIAGTGTPGFNGDGGQATAAQLWPKGVAVDGRGVVYVADTSNHRIRRIDATGRIDTVAGSGTFGSSGDGGPATAATLAAPTSLAIAPSGDVHFVEPGSRRVRSLLDLSPSAPPATASPAPPDPPTDVVAAPAFGSAVVQWRPASNGGRPVTGYRVTVSPSGRSVDVGDPAETATVSGLPYATASSFTVTATTAAGVSPSSAPSVPVVPLPPAYVPVSPARLADTRVGAATVDGVTAGGGAVAPGASLTLQVTGRGGVPPTGVSAIALNITATGSTTGGFLTVHPTGEPRPLASNLNFAPGQTIPNLVLAKVGAGGRVTIYNDTGSTDLIADVAGFLPDGGSYAALSPARLADTRPGAATIDGTNAGGGAVAPGASLTLQVTGRGGVPPTGVSAIALNITATGSTTGGFLTVHPTGEVRPLASNLNFAPGQTIPNLVLAKVGGGGQVTIYNDTGSTNLIADVAGFFADGGGGGGQGGDYTALTPARLADTRAGASTTDRINAGGGAVAPGASLTLQVAGRGGVPGTGLGTVALNITATGSTTGGYLTVYPTAEARPLASNLNFAPGQTVPNLVLAKVGAGGQVTIYNDTGSTDLIVDVAGWFPTVP